MSLQIKSFKKSELSVTQSFGCHESKPLLISNLDILGTHLPGAASKVGAWCRAETPCSSGSGFIFVNPSILGLPQGGEACFCQDWVSVSFIYLYVVILAFVFQDVWLTFRSVFKFNWVHTYCRFGVYIRSWVQDLPYPAIPRSTYALWFFASYRVMTHTLSNV